MDVTKLCLLLTFYLAGQTVAIEQYYKCLECFTQNRYDFFFCSPTLQCKASLSDVAPIDCAAELANCKAAIKCATNVKACTDAANKDCLAKDKVCRDNNCALKDRTTSYVDCPLAINQENCFNYTFTTDNFDQIEPNILVNQLDAGEACWLEANRTTDGSYGTIAIEYDNRYLYVFDDLVDNYKSGMQLGLIEEPTIRGWAPRKVLVANGGLLPTQFNVIYDHAVKLTTILCVLTLASALTLF